MEMKESRSSWENLINQRISDSKIQSPTSKMYDQQAQTSSDVRNEECWCGRLIRWQSYDGESIQSKEKSPEIFHDRCDSAKVDVNVFGGLKFTDCKFLRIDNRTKIEEIYNLLVDDCGGNKPALILSVYGGAKYFTMTEPSEKQTIRRIADAASAAGKQDNWSAVCIVR
jgi:hypothetical protein